MKTIGAICKTRLLVGFSILAFLALALSPSLAADSPTSDQGRAYCVKMGYLYRTFGNDQGNGICEFPDKSRCDAQAFAAGQCGPSLSSSPNPVVDYGTASDWRRSATNLCRNRGGRLQSVHTPYGDVTLCVFPDGSTCDLQAIYSGRCGGDWLGYAYSWLNAP